MRSARLLRVDGVDYIGITGYNQGDTNLMFAVDEAYEILRQSLEGEKTVKTEIDYKERCKELEAKVEKLESMVADLIKALNNQPKPVIFVAKDEDKITKIKNFLNENALDI